MEKAAQYIANHGGTPKALDGDGIPDTPSEAGTLFYQNNVSTAYAMAQQVIL